ncbi:MAG TPA: urate hydroxylase PuuD [Terriglobales bacterium]|nr:urate hydroxylase PuuD [Terriglobales bacterium]
MLASAEISLPHDFYTNFLMLLRWVHFLAGITWIGLLYFFNLIGFPFLQELDPGTRGKVMPGLMMRALWWFRWSAFVTVIVGLAYWGAEVSALARAAGASSGTAMASFFLIWTAVWGILYALLLPGKGLLNNGWVLGLLVALVVTTASCLFLRLNSHGWESNSMLAIGIGGGIGWVLLLNVWGVVWRIQKRLIAWTKANVDNGTPMPERAQRMARMAFLTSRISAWLTLPLLFLMGAASHYQMFK